MTTYQNLLPGTLIEYKKGSDGPETAWVLFIAGPAHTAGMIEIRVKGETGVNQDLEFPIYVKARGRAKIVEKPKIAPTEKFVPPTRDVANETGNAVRRAKRAERELPVHDAGPYREPATGRVMTSHATCEHESTKAARAACRKARAAAN